MPIPPRSFALCLLSLAAVARADAPADAGPVIRTYNVADLIHLPPVDPPHDAAATSAGGGGGGGTSQSLFNGNGNDNGVPVAGEADVRQHVETLVNLIRQAVTPDAWRDNSGNTLAVLDDVLVVTAPDATQRATADLLAGLRRASGRGTVVRVDAQWLLLSPAEMAEHRDGPPPSDPAALYAQARTVGFNGQTVTVTAARTTTVVKSTTPVVAPGAVAYDVTSEQEQVGVTLTVTPRATPGGDVTVDVRSAVTADVARADGPATRPAAGDALTTAIRVATVRPDRLEQNFRTTLRLHPGQPTIVGGMTGEPGAAGDRKSLCLVLTAFAEDGTTATTRPAGDSGRAR